VGSKYDGAQRISRAAQATSFIHSAGIHCLLDEARDIAYAAPSVVSNLAWKVAPMANPPRRPVNPMEAAEALFSPAKKAVAPAVERRALPNTKELVSIKIDSDVLAYFQEDGPGWQDRVNDALRAAMKNGR
jgi:uncharacterized protein (DUF4415 family)